MTQPRDAFAILSAEYYDASKHPTCANFREASGQILRAWLNWLVAPTSIVCELGAGKSLVADVLTSASQPLSHLLITDASIAMLTHSKPAHAHGARLVVAEARAIPLRDECCAAVVSVLGDPYNEQLAWNDAYRVLQVGGHLVFTTPSIEWATEYRRTAHDPLNSAVFELQNGATAAIPSFVLSESDQLAMFERSGFEMERLSRVTVSQLQRTPLSRKLSHGGSMTSPIVTAYGLTKRGVPPDFAARPFQPSGFSR
jgi:ubiquinone/menaquinone biosynthesis C-methylase UbiE